MGQEEAVEAGVPWPVPRFTDHNNGTVTDRLTGLIWLQNANCFGPQLWANALNAADTLIHGSCDLSDGSVAGDWRLPNIKELQSLIDFGHFSPALPAEHPFSGVQLTLYWSSTTYVGLPDRAWLLHLNVGATDAGRKDFTSFVWPVRGGQ